MAYRCKVCGDVFDDESEMNRHLDVHATKTVYRYAYEEVGDGD